MSVITPGRNIVLIGLMGAGKTTVGRLVADRLGRPFVDTDQVVEADSGRTIAQIFAEDGERTFRQLEAAAVRRVSALRGQVIAVGGGAVIDPANTTSLRGTGDLVWLDTPTSVMAMNVARGAEQGTRPLLAHSTDLHRTLDRLRTERHQAYVRAATTTLQTDGRPAEVLADEVILWAMAQPGLLAREERP
jgi:shikimate kinase